MPSVPSQTPRGAFVPWKGRVPYSTRGLRRRVALVSMLPRVVILDNPVPQRERLKLLTRDVQFHGEARIGEERKGAICLSHGIGCRINPQRKTASLDQACSAPLAGFVPLIP